MKRFHQFFKWMKGNKRYYLLAAGILIILQYFRTLTPLFVRHALDLVNGEEDSGLPEFLLNIIADESVKRELLLLAIAFVLFALIRVSLMAIRRMINALFTERIAYNMRNKLYSTLQNLSFTYHSNAETGDLIQRCTTDVETYRVFVGEQLIEIFRLVFLIGFTIYQMVRMNVSLTLISLATTPLIFGIAAIYFTYVKRVFKEVEEAEGKMTTTLQESVTGIRVVKAFAKEKFEIEKFENHSEDYLKKDYRLLKLMAIFWGSTDFIILTQYGLTAVFGVLMALDGNLSSDEFLAFLFYVGMIVWPMRQLGRIVGDFGKTTVALDRIDDIILKENEHQDDSVSKPDITGIVEFKNVGFQFEDDDKPLLKNISFSVNKGETVAIVGRTGSGKSTLINLMIRLLDIQEGSIMFDGVDIKEINKKHLRQNVGIIMQEPFLYSRTVYENIKIMNKGANQDQIHYAASVASLHEDINKFEEGYETMVGERGVTLSGGQKQRVAIARMLLDNKPVLIFDDSLSAVDTETDIQIRSALDKEWKNTTLFIITHRITTAMEADKIIVLDKGEIAEMGNHDTLLKNGKLYAQLWDIQTNVEYDFKTIDKGVE